jgi:hypothetical protein
MPLYEYREGDRIVERVLPVAARDSFPGRITIPRRVSVCHRGEPSQGESVLAGWKDCEEKDGTEAVRQTAASLGLSREQVKQAWLAPDPVDPMARMNGVAA